MKKLLAVLMVVFLLAVGTTSVFADPGGGVLPEGSDLVNPPVATQSDPGGGVLPDGDE